MSAYEEAPAMSAYEAASAYEETTAQDGPLAALAAHGPRYRIGLGAPPPGAPGWLAADRLLDPYGPELSHLLDTEHRGSGHRTAHAAALTLIAVYAGRVTAATVLHWALTGRVLDVRPGNVWLRPDPGHGIAEVRLRAFRMLDEPDVPDAPEADAGNAATVQRAVLTQHLFPLADALRERSRAGLRQLRGGVAHGCATALGASRADPDLLARRWAAFLDGAPGGLAALGDVVAVTRPDGTRRLVYLRRTCCLFYTSAEAVRCASCCLTSTDDRIAAYEGRT
ncbi:(2Fe-2S)-binding protein [Streptomyces rimosus]|uniref:(2Fe-2S)-binding protein n=1 Tax=Streptomyces rimosus TaxID=1927 RepID=UPI0004CA13C4|nr:(2Fe-2S)-binding protein [Streptomyces rimosus]